MILKLVKVEERKTAIIAITENGKSLAEKLRRYFRYSKIFTSSNVFPEIFKTYKNIIAIMSTGIVVRKIANLISSKINDPAVVVIDDTGKNVISLISGHLGGANALTVYIAEKIGANPVITTATDVNKKLAIDNIVRNFGWKIENHEKIKDINKGFLNNEPVIINVPECFFKNNFYKDIPENFICIKDTEKVLNSNIKNKVIVSNGISIKGDFLLIRPKNIYIGLGCNRGTSLEEIEGTIKNTLEKLGKSFHSINSISSYELKSNEKSLLEFSEKYNIKLVFYTKDELNSVIDVFEESDYLKKNLGVKGVCEPSAILSATRDMQKCLKRRNLLPKQKMGNVTIAVQELNFL
jgi:cobalt-precorrin 5A hydrolase